jgi:hypothetical protein
MAWAFSNVAASVEADVVQVQNVPYPTVNAGDIIFLANAAGPIGQAAPTLADTDFQPVVNRTSSGSMYLYWKIANGTESGTMTLTRSTNSGQCYSQMCAFTGGPTTLTGNIHTTNTAGGGSAATLPYPALTITVPNCLVIALASKPSNSFGWNVPAPFTAKISESHATAGMCMLWEYAIQTTATSITAGTFTATTDVANSRTGVAAVFLPASAAPIPFPPTSLGGMNVQVCM